MNTLPPPPMRWGAVNQLFHWASAILLVAIAGIGLYMTGMPGSAEKVRIFALHKSLGLTLLAVVLLRLLWRLTHRPPAPVPGVSRALYHAASTVHWALYALMIAMPVTGWLINSAAGYPLRWFGLVRVPALTGRDESLQSLATLLHESGFWILAALVAGHVFAALYHHVFLDDGTLHRMLPSRRHPREAGQ